MGSETPLKTVTTICVPITLSNVGTCRAHWYSYRAVFNVFIHHRDPCAFLGQRAPKMFQNLSSLYAFDAGCELLEAKRRELLI